MLKSLGRLNSLDLATILHTSLEELDLCVQWLQDPVSLTFNAILTYGCLSGLDANERLPEDDALLVEKYVAAYTSLNLLKPSGNFTYDKV
jgi:hypothetical protein